MIARLLCVLNQDYNPRQPQARSQPQKSEGAPVRSKGARRSQEFEGGGVIGEVLGIRGG